MWWHAYTVSSIVFSTEYNVYYACTTCGSIISPQPLRLNLAPTCRRTAQRPDFNSRSNRSSDRLNSSFTLQDRLHQFQKQRFSLTWLQVIAWLNKIPNRNCTTSLTNALKSCTRNLAIANSSRSASYTVFRKKTSTFVSCITLRKSN